MVVGRTATAPEAREGPIENLRACRHLRLGVLDPRLQKLRRAGSHDRSFRATPARRGSSGFMIRQQSLPLHASAILLEIVWSDTSSGRLLPSRQRAHTSQDGGSQSWLGLAFLELLASPLRMRYLLLV